MKLARQVLRYRCDFCTKVSTKPAMIRHEPTCFKNPNRFCRKCSNTGKHMEWVDRGDYQTEVEVDCIYCKKYEDYLSDIERFCHGCGQGVGEICASDCPSIRGPHAYE